MNTLQKKARNQLLHALQRCEETGLVVCASRERIWIEGGDEDAEPPGRWAAPWPDSEGQRIQEGDTIRHPDGRTGQVVFFDEQNNPLKAWRVAFPEIGALAHLNMLVAIGAVVQRERDAGDAEEGQALPDRRGLVEDFERFAKMRTGEAEEAAEAGNLHASRFLHGKAGGWLEARDFVEDGCKPEPTTAWSFAEDDRPALEAFHLPVRVVNCLLWLYRNRADGHRPSFIPESQAEAFFALSDAGVDALTVSQLRRDFEQRREVFTHARNFGKVSLRQLAEALEEAAH